MARLAGKSMNAQQILDKIYLDGNKAPCCAGCDWWRFHNSMVGDCTKSAPVSGLDRVSMLGITKINESPPSGHIMTLRGHKCGDFVDTYDWPDATILTTYLNKGEQ